MDLRKRLKVLNGQVRDGGQADIGSGPAHDQKFRFPLACLRQGSKCDCARIRAADAGSGMLAAFRTLIAMEAT